MLHTTLYDTEMKVNRGNDTEVLPSIWNFFKQLFPSKSRAIEEGDSGQSDETVPGELKRNGAPDNQNSDQSQTLPQNSNADCNKSHMRCEEEASRKEEEEKLERDRVIAL